MGEFYVRALPNDVQRAFRILCEREGISMNKKIRELIEGYIRETVQAQMSQKQAS